MCSHACNRATNNLHQSHYIEELHTSDDWEYLDDDQGIHEGRMRRGLTMPVELRQILHDPASIRRSKSAYVPRPRGSSMQEEIQDWHRSSVVNPEGELQAKLYSKIVTDDTLGRLCDTIRLASSIVDKGADINGELARQQHVLSTAENDLAIAEYETDQSSEKLKGMKSFKGKLASVIWKKEPKLRINEFNKETSTFSNLNLKGDVGLFSFSTMLTNTASIPKANEDVEQVKINAGIGQLHKTLDAITVQQVETLSALENQEGRLSVFENSVSATHQKINRQTQMINSIMGK